MESWPLTGRNEELDFIAAAVADASLAGVVIAGWAGVGKTRLARHFDVVADEPSTGG